ncbi:MAG: nicotinate-nucleotide adenylyltransferase [Planctomycetota bacterium]
MRLGILGGTFDPVHYGHLLIAETCRERLQLDQVRFVPALQSPLKTDEPQVDGHARADMVQLAVSGCPAFVVDRRELRRSPPSWTIDTLRSFRAEFPDAELVLLLGADSLKDLPRWKEPEEILKLARIAACNRPGLPELSDNTVRTWLGDDLAKGVTPVQIPGTDISSTELRQRIRSGRSIRFLTPRAVEAFLTEHRLYVPKL